MAQDHAEIEAWTIQVHRVARKALVAGLLAVALAVILDVGQHLAELWYCRHIKDLSNMLLENSFGTWLSVVLNFAVGGAALGAALAARSAGRGRATTLAWGWIGLFFLYISLDDHLVLHERLAGAVGRVLLTCGPSESYPFLTYEWIYLLAPVFAAFGLFMLVFVFRELAGARERSLLILAFGLWAVAVALDAWEGAGLPYEGVHEAMGWGKDTFRHAVMVVEETLELLGSTLFLYLFLRRSGALLVERPAALRFVP